MNANDAITNVSAAFEMLMEELENEVEFVNNAGSRAFLAGDYERVEAAKQQGQELTALREDLAALRRRWRGLSETFDPEADDDETTQVERRNLGRLARGVRTPEEVFALPLLQSVAEMGGSARVRDVAPQVEKRMRSTLNETDYEPLPSTPDTPRWYNTMQWCRLALVKEGLLRADSPRGVWEISEAGRAYLAAQR